MALPEPTSFPTASPTRTTVHRAALGRGTSLPIRAGLRALPTSPWPVRLPGLTVIVPTRNESANIGPLLSELAEVGPQHVLFVDDSDDATPQAIRGRVNTQVQLLHRAPGDREGGLGGAVLLGMDACRTPYCAVMDGDLQHPPAVLAAMHAQLEAGADLVIASRYVGAGGNAGLGGFVRRSVSTASNGIARLVFPRRLTGVTDPMSGMFALDLARLDVSRMHPDGFKVLLELLVLTGPQRIEEVPYSFRAREHGESKAGLAEGVTFLRRLAQLRLQAWR